MGCCCSCFEGDEPNGGGTGTASETELSTRHVDQLAVSRKMSAPTVTITDRTLLSGHGMALVGVSIEQDAAYWEIKVSSTNNDDVKSPIYVGLATKADPTLHSGSKLRDEGTSMMGRIEVSNGDIIGVAVQQSDLPMVQFLLNGEPLHDKALNRFRGTVYPALVLPDDQSISAELLFQESDFVHIPPSVRFGPIIVARGLI